jgi:hypothetical protein
MFIEISDLLIHLHRLGLLMVYFAVWILVPELLPDDKKARWAEVAGVGLGRFTELLFSLLYVGGVFVYTVTLFFISVNLLQLAAIYLRFLPNLNFMTVILALPITAMLQIYSMRTIGKMGFALSDATGWEHDRSVHAIRAGMVLFSVGFLLQLVATFI